MVSLTKGAGTVDYPSGREIKLDPHMPPYTKNNLILYSASKRES